jgi:ATP-dependent 26S proteasome regulatory subunit
VPLTPPARRPQVEKAPTESYADIGGLEEQIQEIKESVELPLTHPELYAPVWPLRRSPH